MISGAPPSSLVDSLLLPTRLVANAAQYLLEGLMPGFPAGLFLLLLVCARPQWPAPRRAR